MPEAVSLDVRIVGAEEFRRRLNVLTARLVGPEIAKAYLAAAQIVRDEARREAPEGKADIFGGKFGISEKKNPGTLRKAIVAFKSRAAFDAAAWARVNVFKGTVRAPHGHLVEFGTKARVPKKSKRMVFLSDSGNLVFARRVRGTPPNPFFQRAIAAAGQRALDAAAAQAAKIIEKDYE